MKLSGEQEMAVNRALEWYRHERVNSPVFRLFGYAGTGKTTVLKQLTRRLGLRPDEIKYMAFSGKASAVMTAKGCAATTIHSALYRFVRDNADQLNALVEEMDDIHSKLAGDTEHREALTRRLAIVEHELASPRSRPKPEFTFLGTAAVSSSIRLLVVDECSMVPNAMFRELASLCLPIIFVGDGAQLPAVGDDGDSEVLRLREPFVQLTQVHRQSAESSILHFATRARSGDTNFKPEERSDNVAVYDRTGWTVEEICNDENVNLGYFDQIICWQNETRRLINWYLKEQAGIVAELPVGDPREKLISIANFKVGGGVIANGSMIEVEHDALRDGKLRVSGREDPIDHPIILRAVDGLEVCPEEVGLWKTPFELWDWQGTQQARAEQWARRDCLQAEWAWAMTVHKAQGSEWDKVLIVDDYRLPDRARWLYTAITRASRELVILNADFSHTSKAAA